MGTGKWSISFAAHEYSIDVVEAACAQALEAGLRRADAILNIVSRRPNPPPPKAIEPPGASALEGGADRRLRARRQVGRPQCNGVRKSSTRPMN